MKRLSNLKLTRGDIRNMSDYVLKSTIRSVAKTVRSRLTRIAQTGLQGFSSTFAAVENVIDRMGGKLTTATAGKTRAELEMLLQQWLSLYRVGETAGQVKDEYMRNIKNFFREPRYTKEFINMIGDNIEKIHDLWAENADLIISVLGSTRFQEGETAYKEGDIERLKELLQEVSDELDDLQDDEKDDFLKEFVTPDSFSNWSDDKW